MIAKNALESFESWNNLTSRSRNQSFQQSFKPGPTFSRYLDRNEQPFYFRVSPARTFPLSPEMEFIFPLDVTNDALSIYGYDFERRIEKEGRGGGRNKRRPVTGGKGPPVPPPPLEEQPSPLPVSRFSRTRDTFHAGRCLGQWSLRPRHRYLLRKMRRSFHLIAI